MTLKKVIPSLLLAIASLFVAANSVVAQDAITYFHADATGSPIAATDANGNLLWREDYSPYGERLTQDISPRTNRMWFTGHHQDEDSGLSYAGARHYDPMIGRFLSVDRLDVDATNQFSVNRYAYANDNPYRFVDPDGNVPVDTIWDIGHIIYDIGKVSVGWAIGNQAMVIEGGKDLLVDSFAAAVPYLPAGSSKVARAAAQRVEKEITLSRELHGEAAKHAEDAIRAGKPDVLTIDRLGATANRKASTGSLDKVAGKHLDEYPGAMFKEGGAGASVRPIGPRDNMSSGACIGNACRGLPNGAKVRIKIGD